MSQQAGIWHYDHQPVSRDRLLAFEHQFAMHGPDSRGEYQESGLAMLHRAYYITAEDKLETQPLQTASGTVLTWDGRLDNRNELLTALGRTSLDLPTDAEIVAATLTAWDTEALTRLIGDWALAWWTPREQRLILARDYIGIRKLYYRAAQRSLFWSSDLTTLILHGDERPILCNTYFAGYLTSDPEPHLTPYSDIRLVPPGGYIDATPGKLRVRRYFSFNGLPGLRYKSDNEYEEHFRHVLRQSVRRRLRSAYPVLADLSGGLDSSSIVCMAHDILGAGESSVTLNTVSRYSTDEPGGDERIYFSPIEEFIGKTGIHLKEENPENSCLHSIQHSTFAPVPGYFASTLDDERRFLAATEGQNSRVHLRGFGGDELLGGVQDPIPELASLLWHLHITTFLRNAPAWALRRRSTVWSLLYRSALYLTPIWLREHSSHDPSNSTPRWVNAGFATREQMSRRRLRPAADWHEFLPGPPSPDVAYLSLASSLAALIPALTYPEQPSLPYYDRDFVQFLFSIPCTQILRPDQRRSLMRRSLREMVPSLVLSRKTKWLGVKLPLRILLAEASSIIARSANIPHVCNVFNLDHLQQEIDTLSTTPTPRILLLFRSLAVILFLEQFAGDSTSLYSTPGGFHGPHQKYLSSTI